MHQSVAAALLLCLGLVVGIYSSTSRAEAQDESILPGCSIPKSYGRLITITNPPQSRLAGQAVFEDAEGTVRWVGLMYRAQLPQTPKPQATSRDGVVTFPQLPVYECELGHVWPRH